MNDEAVRAVMAMVRRAEREAVLAQVRQEAASLKREQCVVWNSAIDAVLTQTLLAGRTTDV